MLKCIRDSSPVKPLLKYFNGSYRKLADELCSLEDLGYYTTNEKGEISLTEKANRFLIKTK